MSILETIIEHKKKELESCKELISIDDLKTLPLFDRQTLSMKESILASDKSGIIAEFKRKSPSKGIINDTSSVEEVTQGYAEYGASAISILTDNYFFGGSVDDVQIVREGCVLPILRKEFIIDEYQLYEAKAIGADAILLIAAILNKDKLKQLAKTAHGLGLEVLMEIHTEEELDHLNEHLDIVGVNNRNLKTFEVDLQHSADLGMKIPVEFLKISESGIASVEDLEYLRQYDFRGFLIGENFMKTSDPIGAFSSFVESMKLGGMM